MRTFILFSAVSVLITGMSMAQSNNQNKSAGNMNEKIVKSNEEWKKELSPDLYHVAREQGTEMAFTGKYWDNHKDGKYYCACCGAEVFDSRTKFESGTGWPSFYAPANKGMVGENKDSGFGMIRIEVHCNRCGAHLGHVFDDGPQPTGLRYCINSISLKFEEKK